MIFMIKKIFMIRFRFFLLRQWAEVVYAVRIMIFLIRFRFFLCGRGAEVAYILIIRWLAKTGSSCFFTSGRGYSPYP